MKRVYLLPNIITAFGLSCGLFVIFKMNMTGLGAATHQVLLLITGVMLLAAIADLLDGAIARIIKAESDFGVTFDSISDAITFGVAPSVVVLKSFSFSPGSILSFALMTASMIFSVCGVLRLVRFNVNAQKAKEKPPLPEPENKNFTGLPIPTAALAVISGNLLLVSPDFTEWVPISNEARGWIIILTMIFLGYLMISRLKFPSQKNLQVRLKSFQLVFITALFAVFLFFGVFHHFAVVFAAVTGLYIISGLTLSIIRRVSGAKSQTLADYEPEPDELEDE